MTTIRLRIRSELSSMQNILRRRKSGMLLRRRERSELLRTSVGRLVVRRRATARGRVGYAIKGGITKIGRNYM